MKRVKTADPPRPDPRRLASVPRDVRLTANGTTLIVFAIAFAAAAGAAALVLPLVHVSQRAERHYFDRERVVTDAVITNVRIERDEDNRRRVVTYRYAAPGGEYEGRAELGRRDPRETVEGGQLRIVYLPSKPARSWLQGRGRPGVMPIWLIPMIPIALLLTGAALTWPVRRARALLSEGRVVEGRVLESKKVQDQHGSSTYRTRYEFRTLSGARMTVTADRSRLMSTGEKALIVYHRDDPAWNAMYPLSLVRPDQP